MTENNSKIDGLQRVEDVLDGRLGFRLTDHWGYVSMREGGGHICEWILNRHPGINPLYRWLAANATVSLRYMTLLGDLPASFPVLIG